MSKFFEIVIKNYSGLSSETKPTIAAGNQVPNGSRWREVDTEKTYYFNLSDDTWYAYSTGSSGGATTSTDIEGLGDIAIGVAEVAITITGTPTLSIRITADNANTGTIFIGKTGVLSNGTNDFVRLESGDDIIMSYNDATNALFAISDVAAQSINVGAML